MGDIIGMIIGGFAALCVFAVIAAIIVGIVTVIGAVLLPAIPFLIGFLLVSFIFRILCG